MLLLFILVYLDVTKLIIYTIYTFKILLANYRKVKTLRI